MYKDNIEHDLLKILKRKDKNTIFYVIKSMASGLHRFEIDYLNNIPLDVILVYLEKIIVVGSKSQSLDTLESSLVAVNAFCDNIDKLRFSDLKKDIRLNIKYYLKARKAHLISSVIDKTNLTRAASMLLAGFIFWNLYSKMLSEKKSDDYEMPNTSIETMDETVEMIDALSYEYSSEDTITTFPPTNPAEMVVAENSETIEETTIPKEPTNAEKLQYILEEYNLTLDEFNIVCAVALKEAKTDSYTDAYAVINTMYNRTISRTWVDYVSNLMGTDKGYSLYYQAICSGQFEVYANGDYKMYLELRDGEFYQAIIDFLYTKELMHNFLSFKSASTEVAGSVQFVEGGNNYHNEMKDEDRLDIDRSR